MSDTVVVAPSAPPEPSTEAVAATAAAAVQIAEIDAEARVETERLMQEGMTDRAEIEAEQEDEDVVWLRAQLDGLHQRCETIEAELSQLRAAHLTMQEQIQELTQMATAAAVVATVAATEVAADQPTQEPPSPPPGASGDQGEAAPGTEAAPPTAPAADAPRRKRKLF